MIIININPDEARPSQSRNAVGEIDGEDNGLHALDWHTLSHLKMMVRMMMAVRMKRLTSVAHRKYHGMVHVDHS